MIACLYLGICWTFLTFNGTLSEAEVETWSGGGAIVEDDELSFLFSLDVALPICK